MTTPDESKERATQERRWLRRYGWIFPLVGLPLGLLVGATLWQAVLLNSAFWPARLGDWFTPQGLAIGMGLALIPAFWRLGLWMEPRWSGGFRNGPIAPLLAVLLVLLVEGAFRMYPSQSLFWQAVRARSGNQHMAREISLLREEAAAVARSAGTLRPGAVLLGSSQMVYGIDDAHLGRLTGLPVFRRSVAGLFPIELVASQELADFHPDNRLVLLLSGFDLGARTNLYADAIRPLATPTGMNHVLASARWGFRLQQWRTFIDLGLAARCDLWRSRDYARFLLEHPFAPAHLASGTGGDPALLAQKAVYENLGSNPWMVDLCLRSLERFFADMAGRCRQIVVFEGRVNPAYPVDHLAALSMEMRAFLLDQQQKGVIRYVPINEQGMDLPDSLWRDMTHVNEAGRQLYTEMVARILEPTRPPDPQP